MNLGIDFGSTYTTITTYDRETNRLKDIYVSEGMSPFIPSVATLRLGTENEFAFGEAAREQIGKKHYRPFKAFKMMLPVDDPEKLRARGYDAKYTPEVITERFLDYCIQEALHRTGADAMEHIVVGVPECWNGGINSLDGRGILRRICCRHTDESNVKIVSEPAAASAFFAYRYQEREQKNYSGYILLIDYGGGTLDITLTRIRSLQDGSMQIEVIDRTGAGENEKKEVGSAGILFMESVIKRAIIQAEICTEDEIVRDGRFFRAVNELERTLMTSRGKIQSVFDLYCDYLEDIDSVMRDDGEDPEFTTVDYRGDDLEITYGTLVRVYHETVAGALAEQLRIMRDKMEKQGILRMKGTHICWQTDAEEQFKTALVGGFGNFDLVERQIRSDLQMQALDCTIDDALDREKAVSMGAALLAEGVLSIKDTAPYSIGFLGPEKGRNKFYYGISYKQEIVHDKPYFPSNEDKTPVRFIVGNIPRFFIIRMEEGRSPALIAQMRRKHYLELRQRMEEIQKQTGQQILLACLGFAMNSSGIFSIHVRPIDSAGERIAQDYVIPLSSFRDLFEMTRIVEVVEGERYKGWN